MYLFGRGSIIELLKEEWSDVGETLGKTRGLGIPGVPSLLLASSELIFYLHRINRSRYARNV